MKSESRLKVENYLEKLEIDYDFREHPAVPTVEEALKYYDDLEDVTHCKNLFLRNHKGDIHYLVILEYCKPLDIHALWDILGTGRLSFGSPQRMMKYLGVTPGSVSLFGLINDESHSVRLILDKKLETAEKISFHPNDNTASFIITHDSLHKFIRSVGNSYQFLDLPS